jgi:hypothetical protein
MDRPGLGLMRATKAFVNSGGHSLSEQLRGDPACGASDVTLRRSPSMPTMENPCPLRSAHLIVATIVCERSGPVSRIGP